MRNVYEKQTLTGYCVSIPGMICFILATLYIRRERCFPKAMEIYDVSELFCSMFYFRPSLHIQMSE